MDCDVNHKADWRDVNWEVKAEMDPKVQMMLEGGMLMTRESYLDMRYGAEAPDAWNEEAVQDLPAPFQMINQLGWSS